MTLGRRTVIEMTERGNPATLFELKTSEHTSDILFFLADENDKRSKRIDFDGPLQPLEPKEGFLLRSESFGGSGEAIVQGELERRGGH